MNERSAKRYAVQTDGPPRDNSSWANGWRDESDHDTLPDALFDLIARGYESCMNGRIYDRLRGVHYTAEEARGQLIGSEK